MSRDKLLRAVEKRLNRKVPKDIWAYLDRKNFISEALAGRGTDDPVDFLATEVTILLELKTAPGPANPAITKRRQKRIETLTLMRDAGADLLAAHARKDPDVRSFRENFLPTGTLSPGAVVDWIESNGKSAVYEHAVIVNLPKGTNLEFDGAFKWRCEPPLSELTGAAIENPAPALVLEYALPTSRWAHRRPVARDGVLRTLADLSAALALTYSWQRAQATMFVLTDVVPQLPPDEVAVQSGPFVGFGKHGLRPVESLTRFVITVDSRTTPEEVAELYLKGRTKHLKRVRTLSKRQINLASFASRYAEITKDVWSDLNRQYPEWKYSRYSIFARDARTAADRIMFSSAVDRASLRQISPSD